MKTEVRSLEQAVCVLVTKLNLLLTAELRLSLLKVNEGLHITTPDHLSEYRDDAFVTISPVGWPKESYIQARFFWCAGRWELYEGGQIWANHLDIPIDGLCFEPDQSIMGVTLLPSGKHQVEFVARGRKQLIESLEEGVVVHS